ncbi:RIP metalloprotease RseP [Lutibacter sp. B2]|nr:RIP metalloprotease RseP [Lutibacter sp. B2]
MGTIVIAFLIFGILVLFHEFGHFGVAKLVGIKVHEFSIGMGYRILRFKGKETEYSLRILPIGGYVKMEGEDEASSDENSFNNKPLWARILVIIAGPVMNFILAILLFSISFYAMGFPTTTMNKVTPNFPAELAGIKSGDQIVSINDTSVHRWNDIVNYIGERKENNLKVKVVRDGKEKEMVVKPIYDETTKRIMIGISPKFEKSFIKSISASFDNVYVMIKEMCGFFKKLFGGKASANDVVGPIGIIHLVGKVAKTNIYNVLGFAAMISINLGVVNMLPIPALDGGRLIFLIIEGIIGRPLDPEKEGIIHFTGFVLLMGLMVFMVYKDVMRFIL